MASLVDNLGKDDFKALETLHFVSNKITDAGMARLVAAIDAGGMPKLCNQNQIDMRGWRTSDLLDNPASASAVYAVKDALAKRQALAP